MGEKTYSRTERVGDQIQRELAVIIASEVDDPDVGAVTLSGARVSKDLSHARIYVTPREGADVERTINGLNRAAGFLRRRLGSRLRLRHLPRLRFTYDPTLDRAEHLMHLIESGIGPDRPEDC